MSDNISEEGTEDTVRDVSKDQLKNALKENKKKNKQMMAMTSSNGAPIGTHGLTASCTASSGGPIVLQDFNLLDHLAHFDRERIPERVVHAKGAGAFGYFETTSTEIGKYCKSKLFAVEGKRTPIAARFSTVGGESGSADTARDPRGFAVKFYTEEGNWDVVGNNTPIFFIRDPILFPSFIHTQKRNPKTHLKDPDMFWDFISLRPETTHQVSFVFSDRGTPDGYRMMNGYGSHTFKNVNASGEAFYVKYHFKTDQGVRNLMADEADELASSNPDYAIQDLYEAIETGDFPSWTLYIQVMTFAQAEASKENPFDVTKVWSHKTYPLIEVGRMVLNRNSENYFAGIEQLAFSPAHLIPGIETSPDKMLQGRLFSYSDTHRHRLGTNYQQIPVNAPINNPAQTYQRDGGMTVENNMNSAANYFPNSFNGPVETPSATEHVVSLPTGDVAKYNTEDEDNFTQCGEFYRHTLKTEEKARLVENIAGNLMHAQPFIQERAIKNFSAADADYGQAIQAKIAQLRSMPPINKSSRPAPAPLNPPRTAYKPSAPIPNAKPSL